MATKTLRCVPVALMVGLVAGVASAACAPRVAAVAPSPPVVVARESVPEPEPPEVDVAPALGALLRRLEAARGANRDECLLEVRHRFGTEGLVRALATVTHPDPNEAWYQTRAIFDHIEGSQAARGLNDPRGGDALAAYIATNPPIHWETRAAVALAKIGDLRAVPTLGRRLRMDPLRIYSDETQYEMMLKRDDGERVVAARMLADLAQLHPEALAKIRSQSEDALIFWIHELPSPHANGLRALAWMHSAKDLPALRDWAFPNVPLPRPGVQPPMPEEWVIAQSASRYIGVHRDDRAWPQLLGALRMRPANIDVTMDSLMQGGLAILGMSLRSVGVGAAEGLAEWGDSRAFDPLLKYVQDPKNNEQSRMAACEAMAWVVPLGGHDRILRELRRPGSATSADQFIRECLAETLAVRPLPATAATELATFLTSSETEAVRRRIVLALGRSSFDAVTQDRLMALLSDDDVRDDAALALLLGGTAEAAQHATELYTAALSGTAGLERLQDRYYRAFGLWTTEDLERGVIFRWVSNAEAVAAVKANGVAQDWATALLGAQLANLEFDNGPHSLTRVVLRYHLRQLAKDAARAAEPIRLLRWMDEEGTLLALARQPGGVGELASAALDELLNPPPLASSVSDIEDR